MSIKKPTYKIGHPDISEKPKAITKPPKILMVVSAINHSTQVVVIPKMETAQEDRILKKLIKEDYKHTFKDLLIVRRDQIKKKDFGNEFRGRSITAIEYRTHVSPEEMGKINEFVSPLMSMELDRIRKRVSKRIEEDARQK